MRCTLLKSKCWLAQIFNNLTLSSNLVASEALQSIPELPLEKVYDETVVSAPVELPLLFTGYLRWQPLELRFTLRGRLNRRFMEDPVQVLV